MKILVTGECGDREGQWPERLADDAVEWISLPVLKYERLPIEASLLDRAVKTPFDWIVFSSPRAVKFWSETLIEHSIDFPIETQVACMGDQTAEAAHLDGFTPDFYPTEPGTESFLLEFEELVKNNLTIPSVLIPMAEAGRTRLRERLSELGLPVVSCALYRTLPRTDIKVTEAQLAELTAVVFTSPSSVDALLSSVKFSPAVTLIGLGSYTSQHLGQLGLPHRVIPQSDFNRIAEIL